MFQLIIKRGLGTGEAWSAAAPPTFGSVGGNSSAKVCRCDRLTVMISYRWKSKHSFVSALNQINETRRDDAEKLSAVSRLTRC